MSKAIVLLSGGLDSAVSLVCAKEEHSVEMALVFDYGQKAASKELNAAKKICEYYDIPLRIVNLDWLEIITQTTLVSNTGVPEFEVDELDDEEKTAYSADAVWIPNRNALFVNIAASFADSFKYDVIILGANKEEGQTFKDNSKDFINAVNNSLKNSTLYPVEVVAPLINSDKKEILKMAIDKNIPLQFIRSCYLNEDKQCGICESCNRLKRAILANDRKDLINLLF